MQLPGNRRQRAMMLGCLGAGRCPSKFFNNIINKINLYNVFINLNMGLGSQNI
jgi:hypothetical protein